ncbi:MAG: hypothetical protein GY719_39000 [bacterium]|nr:hypothetical protein [bacterium]
MSKMRQVGSVGLVVALAMLIGQLFLVSADNLSETAFGIATEAAIDQDHIVGVPWIETDDTPRLAGVPWIETDATTRLAGVPWIEKHLEQLGREAVC